MAVFFNQATLTYNGGVANSNIVSGEIVGVITAAKTATPSTYGQGGTVTYVVTLFNSGTTAVTDLTVSDDLGAYTLDTLTLVPLDYVEGSVRYFADGVLQPAPTVGSTSPLTITGISVPAGGSSAIVYQTEANSFAPLEVGGTITNTASVSGGGIVEPVTASATVTAADGAALSITKSVSPTTVSDNGVLTYTFVITNNGNTPANATDNIVVSDSFNPILTGLTASLNGAALTLGTDYTYNEGTGLFATTAGLITVPAATYTQDPATGVITVTPGTATLVVSGTV